MILPCSSFLRGHLEHVAGTLAVARRDERRVEVEVAVLMEIGVDGHRHVVADAQDSAEGVGAGTQVGHRAEILPRGALFLQGIGVVTVAENLDGIGLYLAGLTGGGALHEAALHTDAGAGGDALHGLLGDFGLIAHNLYVVDGAAVVEGHEEYALAAALGADPTLNNHFPTVGGALQCIDYFRSFHRILHES